MGLTLLSDDDLLRQIQARDADAFETLFARYREPLFRHAKRIVRDDTAADDLIQESFLRVWTRAEQWDGRGEVKAWLYRIATNIALNHLRALRRRRERPLELPLDSDYDTEQTPIPAWMIDESTLGPAERFEEAEGHRRLRGLIEALPEEKREVFRLVHDAEMDMRSVAETLGIPEGTVKSRLHHAKRWLARQAGETE